MDGCVRCVGQKVITNWRRAAAVTLPINPATHPARRRLLSGSNSTAPFARRPYVTYMVHAALAVPLVTLGLPLLGLRRGGSRVRTGESTGSGGVPMSTKRRKHKAGHKH